MILSVTLNPALDVTYHLDRLRRGRLSRVSRVHRQAGGKGVNVARVLARLGCPVRAIGFVGGGVGESLRSELAGLEVDERMVALAGQTRQTVTLLEPGHPPTELSEPGPQVSPPDWERFLPAFESALDGIGVVALCGSVPPGCPPDAYRQLVTAAKARACRVVLDTSDAWLVDALPAGPDVVMPNRRELFSALELVESPRIGEAAHACARLRCAGAGNVIASLGARGLVAVTDEGAWRVRHQAATGNPVGAGDALVALVARGLLWEEGWEAILSQAAVAAVASVREPYAGQLDSARLAATEGDVRVTRMVLA